MFTICDFLSKAFPTFDINKTEMQITGNSKKIEIGDKSLDCLFILARGVSGAQLFVIHIHFLNADDNVDFLSRFSKRF
jgi:hypothetical protein